MSIDNGKKAVHNIILPQKREPEIRQYWMSTLIKAKDFPHQDIKANSAQFFHQTSLVFLHHCCMFSVDK